MKRKIKYQLEVKGTFKPRYTSERDVAIFDDKVMAQIIMENINSGCDVASTSRLIKENAFHIWWGDRELRRTLELGEEARVKEIAIDFDGEDWEVI